MEVGTSYGNIMEPNVRSKVKDKLYKRLIYPFETKKLKREFHWKFSRFDAFPCNI